MKKQTKVLVAAALLTLGASFSSMAAMKNGTWVQNEDGWQYVDKDGEYVEYEWCMSYGKELFVDEEGFWAVSRWVEDEETPDRWYYAQSDGSKTINAWKNLYAFDDESEEGDQYWYYFDAKGRMVKNKYMDINGSRYYFGADGKMLTGWIDIDNNGDADGGDVVGVDGAATVSKTTNMVYADENGAVANAEWILVCPWYSEYDETYEDDYEYFYTTATTGKIKTGKQSSIDGLTYFFDAKGAMLSGWVQYNPTTKVYENVNDGKIGIVSGYDTYHTTSLGYADINEWEYLASPDSTDTSSYWYFFDKLGKAVVATATESDAIDFNYVTFVNGEKVAYADKFDTESAGKEIIARKINGETYYFNDSAEMIDGLVEEVKGGSTVLVYLEDGVKQTGIVTLTDDNENTYEFCFAEKTTTDGYTKYVAVTGQYDKKLYNNGQLVKSNYDTYEFVKVGGKNYLVDENGKLATSNGKYYVNGSETKVQYEVDKTADGVAKYTAKVATVATK